MRNVSPLAIFSRAFKLLSSLLLLSLAIPAFAQYGASLSGSVQDATGAIIPGATVTLTNTATNQTQTTTSTADAGFYHFGSLPLASYTVVVSANGFQNNSLSVSLDSQSPRNLNVTMQPGSSHDSITVTADEIPALQTGDASIGATISSAEIQRIPTFGANPYELLRTAPGINGDAARAGNGTANFLPNGAGPGGSSSGIFQTENQTQISADGQRVANNNYMLDGVSVNSLSHGGSAVVTPNTEAVGSLNVISTSYDASQGRNTGAQIMSITKSGTNDIHGSLFFLYDEPGLNSFNKWGGPTGGPPLKVTNKQRTYAASIGGPIVKNKLFLFASYQGFGQSTAGTAVGWVETDQYRAAVQAARPGSVTSQIFGSAGIQPRITGHLTRDCTDYVANPSQYPGQGLTNGPWCRAVNGGIDIGSLTAGGASQIGVYPNLNRPGPNQASPREVGNGLDSQADLQYVALAIPGHSRGNQFNGRVDYQATQKDLIAGSIYVTKLDSYGSANLNSRLQGDVPFKPLNSAGTLIYIHTFSPSLINELRGNVTRFFDNGIADGGGIVNFGIPEAHTESLPVNEIQFGLPQGRGSFFAQNTYEVRDTVSKTFGSHVLRMGVEIRREQDNDNPVIAATRPVYSFQGLWSLANDAPVFEGITANPNTGGAPAIANYLRSENYAAFVQHDWKVTPQLTINSGLRWELFTPIRNAGSRLNYPVLGPAGNELAGMTLVPRNHLWNTQYKNFGPKVGFAYNPTQLSGKMVLRGGFALAYNHLDFALFNTAQQDNGPNLANYNLCCGDSSSPRAGGIIKYSVGTSNSPTSFPANPALATGTGANGFPNPYGVDGSGNPIYPSIEIYGAFPRTQVPYSYLYSLETQFELPAQMTTTIGYAGSLGRHYARLVRQGFIYPTGGPVGGNVYMAQTDSVMSYNGLNVRLERRMKSNFTASVNYTYSKSLDQVSNGDQSNSNANQTDPAHNRTEYGPSDYDSRHRITGTALWELPHVRSNNFLVKAAANGWQINGIATYHTGFPYTPVVPNLQQVGSNPNSDVPNPVRPLGYNGGAGTSCSNDAFKNGTNFVGGGAQYFNINLPVDANGNTIKSAYAPGIGRNSFRGPCYVDVDLSAAKEIKFQMYARTALLRFQANAFNAFNILSLQPITNGNANAGANITSANFGESQGANAGRVIEFLARFQF
ncbi:carboxypeptidase regulatory-like domain-containing protein [Granulicella sp. dw_53]|uniref:TonB-dependent receptor n=1 Tax=Granulicella sp. dw_53 TaxID=2719792 RepID=UPI001BD2DDAA|nr:carboxypeptidase regulatory-like domain-containing protein [Granulicella sp. dw_53]